MPSDQHLMGRVRERDARAFEALFERYGELIRRHLARITRDDAAAQDLVQEVFLRVWTRAEQWDGRGPFKAWLYRIATNLALNHLRSVRRRREQP
jgi:RNA polymerase sigma-70 factor (ECF subfamily)